MKRTMTDFNVGDRVRVTAVFEGEVVYDDKSSFKVKNGDDSVWYDINTPPLLTVEVLESAKPVIGDFHVGDFVKVKSMGNVYLLTHTGAVMIKGTTVGNLYAYKSYPSEYYTTDVYEKVSVDV